MKLALFLLVLAASHTAAGAIGAWWFSRPEPVVGICKYVEHPPRCKPMECGTLAHAEWHIACRGRARSESIEENPK